MSDGEQALADSMGTFAKVVVDGRKVPDVAWTAGRILLSNERLLLVSEAGKETIPLSAVRSIEGRQDGGATLARVSGYVSVQTGSDVTLVAPEDADAFESALYGAVLDQAVVLATHPAVEGGVVQDVDWATGRLTVEDDAVALALGDGRFVEIEIDDVGTVREHDQTVEGDERLVLEAEHTEEGTAVQTHLTGARRQVAILASLLRTGQAQDTVDVDLSADETDVLMALYSGVSPFQIHEFVGMDVDRVEEIYEQLVEAGILEEIRTRRDVSLQARGRSIAGEEMAQE